METVFNPVSNPEEAFQSEFERNTSKEGLSLLDAGLHAATFVDAVSTSLSQTARELATERGDAAQTAAAVYRGEARAHAGLEQIYRTKAAEAAEIAQATGSRIQENIAKVASDVANFHGERASVATANSTTALNNASQAAGNLQSQGALLRSLATVANTAGTGLSLFSIFEKASDGSAAEMATVNALAQTANVVAGLAGGQWGAAIGLSVAKLIGVSALATPIVVGVSAVFLGWLVGNAGEALFSMLLRSGDGVLEKLRNQTETASTIRSPIILDLDGTGIDTVGLSAGVHFDHAGDGFAERTGWVGSGNGLLVWDRNGNGVIDSGRELFGSETVLTDGLRAVNGFAALAELDANGDGVIDASDPLFAELRVWVDGNLDGRAGDGELLTLEEAGVRAINVAYANASAVDANGNEHRQVGSFITTDGQTRTATDVWFRTDAAYSMPTEAMAMDESGKRLALVAAPTQRRHAAANEVLQWTQAA